MILPLHLRNLKIFHKSPKPGSFLSANSSKGKEDIHDWNPCYRICLKVILRTKIYLHHTPCHNNNLLQGDSQVATRRPGRERSVVFSVCSSGFLCLSVRIFIYFLFSRRVVFSVCEDSGHGSSEGEGRVSEVEEEEEEYSYVYSSRVCPAQLIKQQGEEEDGEEENIYEEIGQHLAQSNPSHDEDPTESVQQSSPIVRSHLQLYRSQLTLSQYSD